MWCRKLLIYLTVWKYNTDCYKTDDKFSFFPQLDQCQTTRHQRVCGTDWTICIRIKTRGRCICYQRTKVNSRIKQVWSKFYFISKNNSLWLYEGEGIFHAIQLVKVKVAQSCLTLCGPMDHTVHGILQARILEWVAFPFSRGSPQLVN